MLLFYKHIVYCVYDINILTFIFIETNYREHANTLLYLFF